MSRAVQCSTTLTAPRMSRSTTSLLIVPKQKLSPKDWEYYSHYVEARCSGMECISLRHSEGIQEGFAPVGVPSLSQAIRSRPLPPKSPELPPASRKVANGCPATPCHYPSGQFLQISFTKSCVRTVKKYMDKQIGASYTITQSRGQRTLL